MPQGKISSNTKNAQLKRQGHTYSSQYGQNPDFKGRLKNDVREGSFK